ncbi:phosphate ABC transporter permease PstA, partial [Sphingobacteriales bacterium CHB3]|nr:phosphate ABC transporter permease PstA [Sphingobacteriales bacterium CHB3]
TIIVVMLAMTASIVWGAKDTISWEFLTAAPREGMTEGGIFPAIIGTVLLVLLMSIAGVPAGAITAVYLSEYASQKSIIARSIRFAVNTLAGVPSIVFGLFGLGFFVQFVGGGMDDMFSGGGELRWAQPNILWASLTMALLTLPVVIVSVEEAIKTVPQDLRAGSLALGATKWQTIWKVVLPNSMNGIFTGAILAVSRGAGEVAPILFTGAAYFLPHLPNAISDQFMHLGYHVYIMSTQSTNVDATKGIQYATTLVLLGLTVTLNLSAIILRSRMRARQIH